MLLQKYSIKMCYINIYAVTRNQVLLLIKAKVFDFFLLICYEKKAETFLSVNVKCEKIQTMARKHPHSDQVQKVFGLITNEPSAIFLLQQNRAERASFARYPKKTYFSRQRTILATRSNLKF